MSEMLQLPSLQVSEPQVVEEQGTAWSSSSTPTLRRKHFRMRRARNAEELNPEAASSSKEFLQLPSIEITPSSDEDTPSWSNCSRGASPGSFLIRKWLTVREKKECGESSSQHSSHEDDPSRFLSPRLRDHSMLQGSHAVHTVLPSIT
ncbi:hypothetical protein E2320_007150 [Naja naja]|nr:hypothetical protein E2320_007150 [Naja naja]